MKFCPSCEEEFIDRMTSCPSCEEELVTELAAQDASLKEGQSKEDLLKSETFALTEGPLNTCRELEKILAQANIVSVVYPVKLSTDDNAATLGSAAALKYVLLVSPNDIERCKEVLEGRFYDDVAKEGRGNFVREVVDLDQDEIRCPACEESGPLKDGECQFCGLFLGETTR